MKIVKYNVYSINIIYMYIYFCLHIYIFVFNFNEYSLYKKTKNSSHKQNILYSVGCINMRQNINKDFIKFNRKKKRKRK